MKSLSVVAMVMAILSAAVVLADNPKSKRSRTARYTNQAQPDFKGDPSKGHDQAVKAQAERSRTYVGTQIEPMIHSNPGIMKLQREIAAAFATVDPLPDSRKAHFAWIGSTPAWTVGWRCSIQELSQSPSGWFVRVRVGIQLGSDQGSAFTGAYCDEIYEYTQGQLRFLRMVETPMSTPRVMTFN